MLILFATLKANAQHPADRFRHLLGFTLNQDSLSRVQDRLGPCNLIETGEGGEYEASFTYLFRNLRTVVSFQSGELGGGKQLLAFEVREATSDDLTRHCEPQIQLNSRYQLNVADIGLGLSPDEFAKIIDTTLVWHHDTADVLIEFRHYLKPSESKALAEQWGLEEPLAWSDIALFIQGVFKTQRLIAFSISRTETY